MKPHYISKVVFQTAFVVSFGSPKIVSVAQRQVIWRNSPRQYVLNVNKLTRRGGRGSQSDGPEVCGKATNDNCPRVEKTDEQGDAKLANLKVKRVPVYAPISGARSRVETLRFVSGFHYQFLFLSPLSVFRPD